jgi:hypothetical protein
MNDEEQRLLASIEATTKAILEHLTKPEGKLDAVMGKMGYALTGFGIVGGLYSFIIFIIKLIGGLV